MVLEAIVGESDKECIFEPSDVPVNGVSSARLHILEGKQVATLYFSDGEQFEVHLIPELLAVRVFVRGVQVSSESPGDAAKNIDSSAEFVKRCGSPCRLDRLELRLLECPLSLGVCSSCEPAEDMETGFGRCAVPTQ